jgi:hypothetical protein
MGDTVDNNSMLSVAVYRIPYNASARAARNSNSVFAVILDDVRTGDCIFCRKKSDPSGRAVGYNDSTLWVALDGVVDNPG